MIDIKIYFKTLVFIMFVTLHLTKGHNQPVNRHVQNPESKSETTCRFIMEKMTLNERPLCTVCLLEAIWWSISLSLNHNRDLSNHIRTWTKCFEQNTCSCKSSDAFPSMIYFTVSVWPFCDAKIRALAPSWNTKPSTWNYLIVQGYVSIKIETLVVYWDINFIDIPVVVNPGAFALMRYFTISEWPFCFFLPKESFFNPNLKTLSTYRLTSFGIGFSTTFQSRTH